MTYLTGLNPVRVTITGARGPIGVELEGPLVPGQFLVWNGNRKIQSASGTGADAGLRTDLLAANGGQLVRFQQSGTGATVRTVQDKGRDVLNVADFLPFGYVVDGSIDYSVAFQKALDEAASQRKELVVPAGTFMARNLVFRKGTRIRGQGNERSWIKASGDIVRVTGEFINVSDLTIWCTGGGTTIKQDGLVAQGNWERCTLIQNDSSKPLWDNAVHEFIDMRFRDCKLEHTLMSTVSAFNLVGPGGTINDNTWIGCRIQTSGFAHFFNIESTTANAHYANKWADLTWEVCLGGGIRLRAVNGYVIDNCQNWDADTVPIRNHFYDIDTANGIGSVGRVSDCGRWAGTMASGKVDLKLPGGGGGAGTIIENNRTAGGGDPFKVDAANNGVILLRSTANVCSVINDAGLVSLDANGFAFGANKVVGARGAAIPDVPMISSGDTPTAGDYNGLVQSFNALLGRLRGSSGHGLIGG